MVGWLVVSEWWVGELKSRQREFDFFDFFSGHVAIVIYY